MTGGRYGVASYRPLSDLTMKPVALSSLPASPSNAGKQDPMSFSTEERRTDAALALRLMLQQVGDRRIGECLFDGTQPPFDGVPEPTWAELQESNCVKPFLDSKHYSLTGKGWLRALQESGATKGKEFRRNANKLIASIKRRVKDGQAGVAMVSPQILARDCGLAETWIWNAVESNLIEAECKRQGVKWVHGFEGKMIHVPSDFGKDLG